jgi:dihydroorotate dehydrogenase subfamily 2
MIRKLFGRAYQKILKPILFNFDPEKVHDSFSLLGRILGATTLSRASVAWLCSYQNPQLEQTILGLHFANPIGLSAGFDKNAVLTKILPSVGFGFAEVGSITGEPCTGNAKPRLWRLPKSGGLVVNYGLKNNGCQAIARHLLGMHPTIPIGVSIAKTNNAATVETSAGIADYVKAFRALEGVASYLTINISCPNAYGGEPFTSPARLELLLSALDEFPTNKSIFVKLPVDINTTELDALVSVMSRHNIQGIIISNLTKQRDRPEIDQTEIKNFTRGGISGKPTFNASNKLIAHLFRTTGRQFVIVGAGGVFTAADAYAKIRCGASLIQLITGMIFMGPQVIGEINRGLVELLHQDGWGDINQAIGVDAHLN